MPSSTQLTRPSDEVILPKDTGRKSERLEQLDSMRGLAALSVVILHMLNVFPWKDSSEALNRIWYIWYTPLHIFWAGSEAVMLFFVLSGFVLSIPFHKGTVPIKTFYVKRLFRIYPAYWGAITLGFICKFLVGAGHSSLKLSEWFNGVWPNHLSLGFVLNQYFLLGSFENGKLIPVVWSLVHEMRISLLFPLVMLLMARTKWKPQVFIAFLLYIGGIFSTEILKRKFGVDQDYTVTFSFIPMFMVGATIARYRLEVAQWWQALSKSKKISLLIFGVLAYTFSWWFFPTSAALSKLHVLDRIVITAGCAIFIIAALGSSRIKGFLRHPILVEIGALSYSIYLLHALILISLVRLFWGIVPFPIIFVTMLCISAVISKLMYTRIELPFIAWGKQVARLVEQKKSPQ